jgi:hypothetical protein
VSTLDQRLSAPVSQPILSSKLPPRRQLLLVRYQCFRCDRHGRCGANSLNRRRRSKRCAKCDRLLVKPDLSPSKIAFKRLQTALYVVAWVRSSINDVLMRRTLARSAVLPRLSFVSIAPIVPGQRCAFRLMLKNPQRGTMAITLTSRNAGSPAAAAAASAAAAIPASAAASAATGSVAVEV